MKGGRNKYISRNALAEVDNPGVQNGQSRGAAKLAPATSWIDLRKVCQCKSSSWHTAGGIELSHGRVQCRITMLATAEEKLPALEWFGSPTIICDSRGTWLPTNPWDRKNLQSWSQIAKLIQPRRRRLPPRCESSRWIELVQMRKKQRTSQFLLLLQLKWGLIDDS